jgi:hypothetical protein
VARPEVDLAGQSYRINLILPGGQSPGSKFLPSFQPVPSGTLVSQQFAAAIEEYCINDVEAAAERWNPASVSS